MADRQRRRQAAQLDADRARHLLDLQLEGIREAPIGVVVACDRRATAPACWAGPPSRTRTCGVAPARSRTCGSPRGRTVSGWGGSPCSAPAELADLLGLPDGVETLGWLCLGWPDERPPEPGLQRNGWSRRLPLAEVVLRERWPGWPRRACASGLLPQSARTGFPRGDGAAGFPSGVRPGSSPSARTGSDRGCRRRRRRPAHPRRGHSACWTQACSGSSRRGGGDLRSGTLILVGADHRFATRRDGLPAGHDPRGDAGRRRRRGARSRQRPEPPASR